MSKKRKFRQPSRHVKYNNNNSGKRNTQNLLNRGKNLVLAALSRSKKPVSAAELSDLITEKNTQKVNIHDSIQFLIESNLIKKDRKNRFSLISKAPLYTGTLEKNARGFGFITQAAPFARAKDLTADPYISRSQMGAAQHGDQVLFRLIQKKTKSDPNRPEGSIIRVLSQGKKTLSGFYADPGIVIPEDPRFPFHITIDKSKKSGRPRNGDAVIVRMKRGEQRAETIHGEIVEILGNPANVDVQMRLVIEKFSLPHTFSNRALKETENLSEDFSLSGNRLDLRNIDHVTIDGETAKDFDDAVFVSKTDKGYRLYVSIADVSHFVRPRSALDKEAYERGTSIYFPGRVIPMLPEKLSNDLCSLLPDKDRFTVSAILDYDEKGTLLGKKFARSIIRSRKRFTYTTVKKIVIDNDPVTVTEHKAYLDQLKTARLLAEILLKKRKQRGSIGFTVPESAITLDKTGEIETISIVERNFAHQMIEEFMLAANEAVASFFTEQQIQGLYRIHERPDQEKVEEFCTFAKTLVHLPPKNNTPEWYAGIVEQCRGTSTEYLINNLLLRTMKQARYSPENIGHFGLASQNYTHFTSPIRRYPDLLVHRKLMAALLKDDGTTTQNITHLQKKADFLSGRERTAVKAEREMTERLKVRYMGRRIGEKFQAIISGVTDFAMFVELKESGISGSIGLENLKDDYYLFDDKNHRLIGEISGNIYRIGDSIDIRLLDVDYTRNRIHFIPVNNFETVHVENDKT
ncbi:ribonuclease R [Desulfomarina sp.]